LNLLFVGLANGAENILKNQKWDPPGEVVQERRCRVSSGSAQTKFLHSGKVFPQENVTNLTLTSSMRNHGPQTVLGVPLCRFSRSSMWLHIATKRSKNILPPVSISICMVPLRLKVRRERMMSAR